MNVKSVQGASDDISAQSNEINKAQKAEAKKMAKAELKNKGADGVSRAEKNPKTKEPSGSVMDALRNAWKGRKSTKSASPKIDNTNIARSTTSAVNSGQPARASVTPEKMAEASQKLQEGLGKLKQTEKDLNSGRPEGRPIGTPGQRRNYNAMSPKELNSGRPEGRPIGLPGQGRAYNAMSEESLKKELNDFRGVDSLEVQLEKLESGKIKMTVGEKLILKAQLALAEAEDTGNAEEIGKAKNEVKCCRLLEELEKTENTYFSGLSNLDAIVDNVLSDMPELDSFSVDLKRHIQMAEEFRGQMNQIMNNEGLNVSEMAAQLFEKGLFQRYAQSFNPLILKYEENVQHFNKIDLATMCPPSLTVARDNGSLGAIGAMQIIPIQRVPRYRMLLEDIVKNSPRNDNLRAALDTVLVEAGKLNEEKREAEYKESISKAESELTKAKLTKNDKKIKLAENKLAVAQLEVEIGRAKNEDKILPRDKKILEAQLALAKAEVTGDKEKIKEAKEALNTSLKS